MTAPGRDDTTEAGDTMRVAAAAMREQHGPDHKRHSMWSAMADWLAVEADLYDEDYAEDAQPEPGRLALAVARAYLAAPTPAATPGRDDTTEADEQVAALERGYAFMREQRNGLLTELDAADAAVARVRALCEDRGSDDWLATSIRAALDGPPQHE